MLPRQAVFGYRLDVFKSENRITALRVRKNSATGFEELRIRQSPNTKLGLRVEMTLEQACPLEY